MASGQPYRNIAKRYGTSIAALHRHKAHAGGAIVRAAARRGERTEDSTLSELRKIQDRLWGLVEQMAFEGDHRGQIVGLKEIRETLAAVDGFLSRAQPAGQGAADRAEVRSMTDSELDSVLRRELARCGFQPLPS